jgi:hypothetical protein
MDEAALLVVAGNVRRCIAYGARVSASQGMKKIEDIVVGDQVLGSDGEYHKVTNTFDQGVQQTISIKTQLSSISVTPNHRMAVMDALNHYVWVEAKYIKVGDSLVARGVSDTSWTPSPVVAIEPGETVQTYDIEVADVHEFIVEGLLSHNSANIRQGSDTDPIFRTAKDNLWQMNAEGKFTMDPERDALRMSNHTRVFHHKPSLQECIDAVAQQCQSGEGAIAWAGEAVARSNADLLFNDMLKRKFLGIYSREGRAAASKYLLELASVQSIDIDQKELAHRMGRYLLNPCFAAGTLVRTSEGHRKIEDLVGKTVSIWDGNCWRVVSNFRVTGINQSVYKVTLRSGDSFVATENHSLILENYSRTKLADLRVGEFLMPCLLPVPGEQAVVRFDGWNQVEAIEPAGIADKVYCCTVPRSNAFALSIGVLVGNCGEILMNNNMCNLSEIHLNLLDPLDLHAQGLAFQAGGLNVGALLHHRFVDPDQQYSREVDPIVGVSFTGLFDFFVNAFGLDWLKWWEAGRPDEFEISTLGKNRLILLAQKFGGGESIQQKGDLYRFVEKSFYQFWRGVVETVIHEYCSRHGLRQPNRCTTVQPAGSKSLLTGASPGWHPPKAAQYIRRMGFRREDPVALACRDFGYNIIPSETDKNANGELLDDPFDPLCTEWLVEIPVSVSWADIPGVEAIDVNRFSALAQMDFYMGIQSEYTRHNTSATIELRTEEVEPLATRIYNAIQNDEGYVSVALLRRFDDLSAFPRLPFEPITREEYLRLNAEVLERRISDDFGQLLSIYDQGYGEEVGPAACDSGKCLIG